MVGNVIIKAQEAIESLAKTEEKGVSLGAALGKSFADIGKAAAAVGTAIVGASGAIVGGMMKMASDTAAYTDEIDKLSERTGINREELQRWKYAAGQSGADIGKLEVGIKTLSASMVTAGEGGAKQTAAFEALGISIDDLANKSQEDIFDAVITGLAGMEQGAERNALGNSLLGKSYTELMPLINAGAEGIDELKNRADELGLVMSEDAILAGVAFGDTMDDVQAVLGSLTREIGSAVMPKLTEFLNFIIEQIPTIKGYFEQFTEVAEKALSYVIDNVIPPLTEAIKWIIDHLDILVPIAIMLGTAFLTWNVVSMIQGLVAAIGAFSTAVGGASGAMKAFNLVLKANAIGIVISLVAAVAAGLIYLWNTNDDFRDAVITTWSRITYAAQELWGNVIGFFADIPKKIKETLGMVITAITQWAPDLLTQGVKAYVDFVVAFWTTALELPKKMLEIGAMIVQGVVDGIAGGVKGATEAVTGFFGGLVGSAKNFLGIKSPSKVFNKEVGAMIAEGTADGITENSKVASDAAAKMSKETYGAAKLWIDDYRNAADYLATEEIEMWKTLRETYGENIEQRIEIDKNINRLRQEEEKKSFAHSKDWIEAQKQLREMNTEGEIEAWERVQARYNEGTELRKKADDELFKAKLRLRDEEEKAAEQAAKAQEKAIEEQEKAIQKAIEAQQKLADEQGKLMQQMTDVENKYTSAVQSRSDAIANSFGLFAELSDKEAASSKELLKNLDNQVEAMRKWSEELAELSEKGIDEGLLQKLREMGPSAYKEISALNDMTAEELEKYNQLWAEKNELAKLAAIEELQGLRASTNAELSKLSEEMEALTKQEISPLGEEMMVDITQGVEGEAEALRSAVNVALVKNTEVEGNKMIDTGKAKQAVYTDTWKSTFSTISNNMASSFQELNTLAGNQTNRLISTMQGLIDQFAFPVGVSLAQQLGQGLISQEAVLYEQAQRIAAAIRAQFANSYATTATTGGTNYSFTPHATGLDFVPYDGYLAELHKGEAVLTAQENRERQEASSGTVQNFYINVLKEEQTAFAIKRELEKLGRGITP